MAGAHDDTRHELEEGAFIRRATLEDLDVVLAVKQRLAFRPGADSFLLGSTPDVYAHMLAAGRMWLLVAETEVIGFTVTHDAAMFEPPPSWPRIGAVEPGDEPARVGYFDQLAVLPQIRRRSWSASLALCALTELVAAERHAFVLTTTVVEPVVNRAALPYLAHLGAVQIGLLDEHYPEVGPIKSALHAIAAAGYWAYVEGLTGRERPNIAEVIAGVAQAARHEQVWVKNP